MQKLKSVSPYVEGTGISLFLALFGIPFVVAPLFAIPDAVDATRLGMYPFLFGWLCMLAVGVMLVWGGLAQANLQMRFGRAEGSLTSDEVCPGQEFHFLYKRPVHRATNVLSIRAFLVFRERVQYDDGSEIASKDVDRLIETCTQPARAFRRGENLEIEHTFRIPDRPIGWKNRYQDRKKYQAKALWVVKVRIQVRPGYALWDEYEVQVFGQPLEAARLPAPASEAAGCDVWLVGATSFKTLQVTKEICDLLPYLREGQAGDLYFARPAVLLESIDATQALSAKERLEAAGAVAAIRPAAQGLDER